MSHWFVPEKLRHLSESLWRVRLDLSHLVEGLPLLELLSGIHELPSLPMIFAGSPGSIVISFGPQCVDPS